MKSNLKDQELIEHVREWIRSLCDTGGRSWRLTIPARIDKDPDLLISELCSRFQTLTDSNTKTCNGCCEMNYCDENGCIERKRNLVEPSEVPQISSDQLPG